MAPNLALPYIYLPLGTCEEAANHLPVSFNDDLGFYLWDTADPQFRRIVDSPAHLGFILSDRTATNITIKVPFRLLNLTLTAPIVNQPTAYFPCVTDESIWGFWELGRAFLQGAFFAVDYDANLTYLAQAPGPSMGGSGIKVMGEDGKAPEGFESELEASWAAHWTVLHGEGGSDLSAGAIAGIVVGVVVLVGGVLTGLVFWRKIKAKGGGDEKTPTPTRRLWVSWWKGAEIQGMPVQEMEVPDAVHEAPGRVLAHEISGRALAAELPASPIK